MKIIGRYRVSDRSLARSLVLAGLSDPYCVLRVSNGLPAKRTKVIKKTLNPTWNQEFYWYPRYCLVLAASRC